MIAVAASAGVVVIVAGAIARSAMARARREKQEKQELQREFEGSVRSMQAYMQQTQAETSYHSYQDGSSTAGSAWGMADVGSWWQQQQQQAYGPPANAWEAQRMWADAEGGDVAKPNAKE